MEYNVTSPVLWNITNLTTSTTSNSQFGDELSTNNDSDDMLNCTNEYCISNEDYHDIMWSHVFPTTFEWFFIFMHSLVFIVGLVGNALVCLAVYRNHSMRTVTNYFIVNLAVADFMVILICLPPTVLWDVTETWFMGTILCKVVLYLQTVSVVVSVLTLTFISIDRWYAICFPLKFKSTTGRAKTAIFIIWLVALGFDVPELVVLTSQPKEWRYPQDTILFTQCVPMWSYESEMAYYSVKGALLYFVPLFFMTIAYCQIVRVLWRSDNIPGHCETKQKIQQHHHDSSTQSLTGSRRNTMCVAGTVNTTTEGQVRSRRKAAKMLVAVVIMFALCYLPVHLINILRYAADMPQNDITGVLSMLSHWLCYANSAVNPIIYNFMSGKFRKEFQRTFGFWCWRPRTHRFPGYAGTRGSTYICRFTTGRTETMPLNCNTSNSIADVD